MKEKKKMDKIQITDTLQQIYEQFYKGVRIDESDPSVIEVAFYKDKLPEIRETLKSAIDIIMNSYCDDILMQGVDKWS